jgi:hypothetical protein
MTTPTQNFGHNSVLETDMRVSDDAIRKKQGPYLEVGKWDTILRIVSFAEKEIPQAKPFRFDFELFDDWDHRLPPVNWISRQLGMGEFNGG